MLHQGGVRVGQGQRTTRNKANVLTRNLTARKWQQETVAADRINYEIGIIIVGGSERHIKTKKETIAHC